MSTNLYYRPITTGASLSDGLKYIFNKNGYFNNSNKHTLLTDDITFLRGVSFASTQDDVQRDASLLINAIEKYGEIEIYLY